MGNIDYTSTNTHYMYDVNTSPFFIKNNKNFINIVGEKQLNTLKNTSILDIYLSKDNIVEPHYHPNMAELVYCISGSITISILNPFTNQVMNFPITEGQVVNIPASWWHYEIATSDNTHILAIFDAPNPEVVLGSNILKFTPAEVMSYTYCLDYNTWRDNINSVSPNTYIGPACQDDNSNQKY